MILIVNFWTLRTSTVGSFAHSQPLIFVCSNPTDMLPQLVPINRHPRSLIPSIFFHGYFSKEKKTQLFYFLMGGHSSLGVPSINWWLRRDQCRIRGRLSAVICLREASGVGGKDGKRIARGLGCEVRRAPLGEGLVDDMPSLTSQH